MAAGASALPAAAQTSVPPNQVTNFIDTSMLKPPAGAKVAIIEWEDLECPACAHAFPFVHQAADHKNPTGMKASTLANGSSGCAGSQRNDSQTPSRREPKSGAAKIHGIVDR